MDFYPQYITILLHHAAVEFKEDVKIIDLEEEEICVTDGATRCIADAP